MKIIKIGVFILIFILLFNLIARLLWINKNSISYFYDEPKNSLDVIYVGSSNAYVHFNTILAYHLYGFTTGMLSTDSQMFALVKYLVKYQNPSLYVIDIAKIADDFSSYTEGDFRKTIDSMKFSKNRIDAINEVLNLKKIDKAEYINFYFSFFMYHNRWQNIGAASFVGDNRFFKGYFFTNFTSEIKPQEEYTWNPKFSELQKENKQILMDIINYIKQSKLNVLFVVPKRHYPEEINERIYSFSILQN